MRAIEIKKDFPILNENAHRKNLVYLDNAATSQKPKSVITAMTRYYEEFNANVHRSVHKLSELATEAYERAHEKTAQFIGAQSGEEIIFTKNTTEALNLLAYTLCKNLKAGEEIVLTEMEHHSNLVPWQQIAKEKGLTIRFIKVGKDFRLDIKHARSLITDKTKIVSCVHLSNVLGTINPVKELAQLAHKHGAVMVVDGAQSAAHLPIDVKDLDCDFFAFSGHKMLGPTGIGVLYGKKSLLENMDPFLFGGGMIAEVTLTDVKFADLPAKFEAGTPNIAEAIGLSAAIEYLEKIGMTTIAAHEERLTEYALVRLSTIPGLTIYGPHNTTRRGAVISFNVEGIHPHDLASALDRYGVAVRAGNHCTMPLMNRLGINGSARASFYLYNDTRDVDALAEAIGKAKTLFKV
ncbi:cysteine desulfurase [Candidatus Woesearchaeota archaeon]|nr:cysteine desulfurase [Candidatus Woesearchaeota archaeon]